MDGLYELESSTSTLSGVLSSVPKTMRFAEKPVLRLLRQFNANVA